MQLLKEYCSDGNRLIKSSDKLFMFLGVLGASVLIYSLSLEQPQIGYVIGSSLMLIVALHFKLVYYIALEMILISGHSAILLGIGSYLLVALPLLLCFQLFFYYLFTNQLKNIYLLIGIAGISLLSIGFAFNNHLVFFLGSTAIAIYSFYYAIKGEVPCYLWAFLNMIFGLISLIKLFI